MAIISKQDVPEITVRNAVSKPDDSGEDDTTFILAAWDSTLPFLASIGAGEMWGDEPFSQREGQREEVDEIIRKSDLDPEDDERRFLVAEIESDANELDKGDNSRGVRVGAAIVQDSLPEYISQHADIKTHLATSEEILYLEVLFADQRRAKKCRGAGAALVEAVKARARIKGKTAVYVDVWAGNGRKLNAYYEKLGFDLVGDFGLKRRNGSVWPGTLYRVGV